MGCGSSRRIRCSFGQCAGISSGHVRATSHASGLTNNDSVKTRLQVQVRSSKTGNVPLTTNERHYESTMDAISQIIEDEGIAGLYSGLSGSLIGVASTNFAYFYWYSVVRQAYTKWAAVQKAPSTSVELSLGAIAGALAQLFTIPVAVITTRQQTQPKGEKRGLIDTAKEVIDSEDGWSGLWRGLRASLVLVINPSITYGAYQRLRDVMYPGKLALRPAEAFRTSIASYWIVANTYSPRSHVEITSNHCNSTTDCCQGWSSISTSTSPSWKTIQEFSRSHGLHYRTRRLPGTVQGYRSTIVERSSRTRIFDDGKRTSRIVVCVTVRILENNQGEAASESEGIGQRKGGSCRRECSSASQECCPTSDEIDTTCGCAEWLFTRRSKSSIIPIHAFD